jgi:sugar/nucleoside kinase (ribokinase family)
VAAAAARLGCSVAFVGAVGRDPFGRFLARTLRAEGVDCRGLRMDSRGRTPIAFVSLRGDAKPDFLFLWERTADRFLEPRAVPHALVRSSRIFHFGTIGLIHPATRRATEAALETALGSSRVFISCDPNVRLDLWPSLRAARRAIRRTLRNAHLVKLDDAELRFLTGHRGLERGVRALAGDTGAAVAVTLGSRGAVCVWGWTEVEAPAFRVRAVDTTGAGDGFMAGLLTRLAATHGALRGVAPSAKLLERWLRYANAVGALATTRRGAIPAFPTRREVGILLRRSAS